METQDKETTKKPYTAPQLFVYGDIREVTLTTNSKNAVADVGAKSATDKTA
jgi:hypothetical protein